MESKASEQAGKRMGSVVINRPAPAHLSPLQRTMLLQSGMVRAMIEAMVRDTPSIPPATAP